MRLVLKKMGRSWWVLGDEDFGPIGPYKSRAEADESRRGLNRFERYKLVPGYICSSESSLEEED